MEYALNTVTVPTLTVGGYYDQEDMFGPQEEYAKLEPHDTASRKLSRPWARGGTATGLLVAPSRQSGLRRAHRHRVSRAESKRSSSRTISKIEPGFDLENTASFQTGSNTWKYYAHFPPRDSRPTALYLDGAGMLSWTAPTASTARSGSFLCQRSCQSGSLPASAHPAHLQRRLRSGTTGSLKTSASSPTAKTWPCGSCRFSTNDLTITGEVVADIFASTTGSDNDLVVKLIDEYPDDDPDPTMRGYQLMTNAEIFRGRYLAGFDHPTALAPGSIHEYKFSLHDVDHVFKAGHTVMVEIQSTWFPLYDRNPQTFVPNIMKAKPADYKAATITIYSGPGHDSAIEIPVMGAQ